MNAVCVKVSCGCGGDSHTPVSVPQEVMYRQEGWPRQAAVAQGGGKSAEEGAGLLQPTKHSSEHAIEFQRWSNFSIGAELVTLHKGCIQTSTLSDILQNDESQRKSVIAAASVGCFVLYIMCYSRVW